MSTPSLIVCTRTALVIILTAMMIGTVAIGPDLYSMAATGVSATDVQRRVFVGHVRADPNSTIKIRMDEVKSRRVIKFEARRIKLICDDGTEPRQNSDPVTIRVRKDGSFNYSYYKADAFSQDQVLYLIEGELRLRRARGTLAQIIDPWDPPDGDNRTECSTLGKAVWKAKRVR